MPMINEKYNVITRGDKTDTAILLLHGIGADHLMWHLQMNFFANKGYFVIIPDLLGHGNTEYVSNITLEDWNQQILNIINFYSVNKVIIVGVSMGGVIAQNFAINHEDKINQLILSDTFCELKTVREKLLGYSQVIGFKVFKFLGSKMLSKGMASTYKADFAHHAKEYFSSSERSLNFQQLILARKAINKANLKKKLETLRLPSLIMVGDEFGGNFVRINKKIADHIPNSKFVILDKAMDPSCLTNPQRFNKEVLSFIKK